MDFRKALIKSLTLGGERAGEPTLLYNALCDTIGNNLQLKPQAETFHRLNQSCHIVEGMMRNPDPGMILTLLEGCKKQPNAPEKLCLKWIHTVFEMYYRANRDNPALTEQVLKSVEEDFLEPEQEGLALPTPKKNRQKQATWAAHSKPASAPSSPAGTPSSAQAPPQAGLRVLRAPQPSIPDRAWVYLAERSPTIHLSSECPHIRPSLCRTLYRATYERARYVDFVRANNLTKHTRAQFIASKNHCPPMCPKCGDFTPVLSEHNPKRTFKQL